MTVVNFEKCRKPGKNLRQCDNAQLTAARPTKAAVRLARDSPLAAACRDQSHLLAAACRDQSHLLVAACRDQSQLLAAACRAQDPLPVVSSPAPRYQRG